MWCQGNTVAKPQVLTGKRAESGTGKNDTDQIQRIGGGDTDLLAVLVGAAHRASPWANLDISWLISSSVGSSPRMYLLHQAQIITIAAPSRCEIGDPT